MDCESAYHAATAAVQQPPAHMSFESAITIILTALAVMLAILAIGIGAAAIWGYSGIKDEVKKMASKHVEEAMQVKLKEYPEAADMLDLAQRLRSRLDFLDQIQNQIVISPAPRDVETASKTGIKEEAKESGEVLPVPEADIRPVEPYPGEEEPDASSDGSPKIDPGSNNS